MSASNIHNEEDKSFLWFDSEAERAAKFYVGIFKNSKIEKIASWRRGRIKNRSPGGIGHDGGIYARQSRVRGT
ncbi:MAG: hypothetical protein DME52_07780 [Verrucomicrobia bacterium]|nr:MAG: hypothetical protein DME84_06420 [Verrucomicrobiota bacterium]PYK25821.1 MAG: hypothetical protein DME52_07780 [Verrucomicrobiota bacterium]PYK52321.1 MAG: hypothetical protein DME51_00735 [Verrucomicrobiota bacterium]